VLSYTCTACFFCLTDVWHSMRANTPLPSFSLQSDVSKPEIGGSNHRQCIRSEPQPEKRGGGAVAGGDSSAIYVFPSISSSTNEFADSGAISTNSHHCKGRCQGLALISPNTITLIQSWQNLPKWRSPVANFFLCLASSLPAFVN
jgi:hypothetical protein